jgi:DNA-binding MarR family transcriptional regulator
MRWPSSLRVLIHSKFEKTMHGNLLMNLLAGVYWFTDAMQDNLEAQGFPRTSRAVAYVLLNIAQGEHRATKIAKNLGITRQAVSQVLLGLQERGMIDILEDPTDRRSQIVNFSPKFVKQGAACVEILTKLEAEIGKRIGMENLRVMRRALALDWGAPPTYGRLSAKEIQHGKLLWNAQNLADPRRKLTPRKQMRRS